MKKIIKIIFFVLFYILFFLESFAGYEINDLGDIYENINEIDGYKGDIGESKIGFFGNNSFIINKNGKAVYGYFDKNKKTIIKKIDVGFLFDLGYLGNTFSFSGDIVEYEIVKGYFDEHKKTIISKKIPDYNFSLGYLGDIKIVNKNTYHKKKVIKQKSYKELLEEYIKQNTLVFALENNIKFGDYNIFVGNILDFIFEGDDKVLFGDDIEKVKIEIAKTDFLNKIKTLLKNTKNINTGFKKLKTKQEKIYMLDYYLK